MSKGKSGGTWVLVLIIVCLIISCLGFATVFISPEAAYKLFSGSDSVASSTVKRSPLPIGSVNETHYYNGDYGQYFMQDKSELEQGLKYFYQKTGVQPYLHFTISIGGSDEVPSARDLSAYSEALYPKLFTDESHLLLVFYYSYPKDTFRTYIVTGSKAKSVIDSEAENILTDYIERYYNDGKPFDQLFSMSFSDAADRIMNVTPSPFIPVLIGAFILILLILLFLHIRKMRFQKALKARQTKEMLEMPLEKYGDIGGGTKDTGKTF